MKLSDPFVITISREVGSGGGTVARKLAEKLNVNYVSKQLMQSLEERFNLTPAGIEHLKSTKKNWFTDLFEQVAPTPKATIKVGGYTYSREIQETVTVQDIFEAEKEILNAIADEVVVAFAHGAVVHLDQILVDCLVMVTLDQRSLAHRGAVGHPEVQVIVGTLLEQDIGGVASRTGIIIHDGLAVGIAVEELTV